MCLFDTPLRTFVCDHPASQLLGTHVNVSPPGRVTRLRPTDERGTVAQNLQDPQCGVTHVLVTPSRRA